MEKPGHTIAETHGFLDDCREAGVSDQDRAAIVDVIASNPQAGDVIQGAGGARKLRIAGRGRGKSGGFRLITAFVAPEAPVYLLALYAKGERGNLTKAQVNDLRDVLSGVKKYWKERAK